MSRRYDTCNLHNWRVIFNDTFRKGNRLSGLSWRPFVAKKSAKQKGHYEEKRNAEVWMWAKAQPRERNQKDSIFFASVLRLGLGIATDFCKAFLTVLNVVEKSECFSFFPNNGWRKSKGMSLLFLKQCKTLCAHWLRMLALESGCLGSDPTY